MIELLLVAVLCGNIPSPVVRVTNSVGLRGDSVGSGVIIHDDGRYAWILSCGHIFRDGRGSVRICSGGKCYTAEIVKVDVDAELSLMRMRSAGLGQRLLAERSAQVGDMVERAGYTQGVLGYCRTVVTGWLQTGSHKWLSTELRVPEGVSGGPVFNEQCEVVGITWGDIAFVPLQSIRAFLESAGWSFSQPRTKPVAKADPMVPVADLPDASEDDVSQQGDAPKDDLPLPHPQQDDAPETPVAREEDTGRDVAKAVVKTGLMVAFPQIAGLVGGTALTVLAAQFGAAAIGGMLRRRRDRKRAQRYAPQPQPQVQPQPDTQVQPKKPFRLHMGWSDEETGVKDIRNNYIRVETDLVGQAYKQAVADYARHNPRTAGILQRVEMLAGAILDGLRVKHKQAAVDNPLIQESY